MGDNPSLQSSAKPLIADEISSTIGYTYKCLASGIWALRQGIRAMQANASDLSSVFERVITELTMAGGDADTNAAVAGSLLGTLIGYSNLTTGWVQDLKHRDWLLAKADAASYLIIGQGAPYDYHDDIDTTVDAGKGPMSKEEMDARWGVLIEVCVADRTCLQQANTSRRCTEGWGTWINSKKWKETGKRERIAV